ncbi:hypothetical protein CQ047_12155 [Microbacterium sp. MYb72]|uniref:hypothetical protein n=1 Tax=Microbacterium sp. MYb72 TaxID=1848693 RepID=UPI000CFBA190|nr:hypothetical protein [Microbacterium sp. MYb72]PRB08626.1 hypothetical protein CQ047_12155 [Microbacterium sp. MYb72]
MDITLPSIPAGVLVLLGLIAPYAIAALNGALPFVRTPSQRKAVAIVVAIVLAVVVLAFYFAYTGDVIPEWPVLVLLAIVVVQASYALIAKSTASAVEKRFEPGETLRRDRR